MFRGVNALNLDNKGRLAIPARYRDELGQSAGGRMMLTVNPVERDHCLLLYPMPEWEELERKLVKLSNLKPQSRRLQRLLIGHATEMEFDANGRILLPPLLREFAGLEKSVVMIGQGNKFEIWDETQWNTRRAEWLSATDGEGELPDELGSLSL